MKSILVLSIMGVLTACSMAPNQTAQRSNSIRIIKEQPKHYEYHRKYNSKIEQVDYNSSIITPEVEPEHRREVKSHKRSYGNKITNRVTHKITSKVSSKTNQVESKASSIVNSNIDRGLNSLFR